MENIPNKQPMFYYTEVFVKHKNKQVTKKAAFAGVVDNNTISIGQAICSNKDIFDKKLARTIATGRAIKKPLFTVDLKEYKDRKHSDIFVETCKTLLKF